MKKALKITLIAAGAAAVIAAGSFAVVSAHRSSPEYALSLAERYLSELNYEQAIIEFEKYLEIEPMDTETWLKLAEAYEDNGDIDGAIEALERALTYVDDKKISDKLAELMLIKNPPETTDGVSISDIDPIEVEQMLLAYIKGEGELNTEMLEAVTKLQIYGNEFVFVECGDKKGTYIEFDYFSSDGFSTANSAATEENQLLGENRYSSGDISDISFLEHCKNATRISIYCNSVSDISVFEKLDNLKSIALYYNKVSDITPLSNSTNLTGLYLYGNMVEDISPLKNLTNLEWLGLGGNMITDISPLESLPSLAHLYLWGNPIPSSDLEALKSSLPECEIYY